MNSVSTIYDNPWSKILSKADGILRGGFKYSAYENSFKKKRSKLASTQSLSQKKNLQFNTMVQTNHNKRKVWSKKVDEKRKEMEDSLVELEDVLSDEEEQKVPVEMHSRK
jgi:hypothetical protein